MTRHEENPFDVKFWITWMVSVSVAVVVLTSYLYMNYQTKESFSRIEDKVDQLLNKDAR